MVNIFFNFSFILDNISVKCELQITPLSMLFHCLVASVTLALIISIPLGCPEEEGPFNLFLVPPC